MNSTKLPDRKRAITIAVLVMVLWSTSWVLIRFGLAEIPALTFAGLRYTIAAVCLLPFLFQPKNRQALRDLTPKQWMSLIVLGVIFYSVAQGAQFFGLFYLSMASTSLLLNLTSLFVAGIGMVTLHEKPTILQWSGIFLNLFGIVLFFYPPIFSDQDVLGIVIVMIGVLANTFGTLVGRKINRIGNIPPVVVTTVSMSIGAVLLLITGLVTQGLPKISPAGWGAILWMSVVNTALAFTLWNYTQRTLQAMESSIINSLMTVMIAILGWVISGESLNWLEIIGIVLVTGGVLLVQLRQTQKISPQNGT